MVRIALIPVFLAFLLAGALQPWGSFVAALIFGVAALTDTVDGYVARWQRHVTVLGQFLDPVADKMLISAALVALVEMGRLPAWVAIIIIAREFAVSGLRLVAMAEGKVLTPSVLGKVKTVLQAVTVIVIILQPPWRVQGIGLGSILLTLAVALTVVSGMQYFLKAGPLLFASVPAGVSAGGRDDEQE